MTAIPVFSGGTGKSGTSIIAALLGRHPDAYASRPREIRFLTDRAGLLQLCYGPPPTLGGARRRAFALHRAALPRRHEKVLLSEFTARITDTWWDRKVPSGEPRGLSRGLDREALDRLVEAFTRDYPDQGDEAARAFLFGVIEHQRGFTGQRYWIDTTPKNIENADRIARLTPQARFIYMARDGRDTAISITKQFWGPDEPFEALRWWAARTALACRGIEGVPPSSVLTLHLEDLVVLNRETSLRRLLDFLGLAQTRRVRTFFDEQMPADRVEIGKWRRSVPDPDAFNAEFERLVAEMAASGIPASRFTTSAPDG